MITSAYREDCYEFRGLSTDEKPIDKGPDGKPLQISNGSVFFEMDTCKVFLFDAQAHDWIELN